jgi:hypothetical protein
MNRVQRIARAAALGAVLLFGVADAATADSSRLPFQVAGPATLSSDAALCERVADALNAEPANLQRTQRRNAIFAPWQPLEISPNPQDPWKDVYQNDRHETTWVDILNAGRPRRVIRVTGNPLRGNELLSRRQMMMFMVNDDDPLPRDAGSFGKDSVVAVMQDPARAGLLEDMIYATLLMPDGTFLRRFPAFNSPAGRCFGPFDAEGLDIVLPGDGRVMVLREETDNVRKAMLVEIRGQRAFPVCYFSGYQCDRYGR